MGRESKIEWTDATFNPWWGCEKVSPACLHCYAEDTANRFMAGLWGSGPESKRRFFDDDHWNEPLNWNRRALEGFFRECTECGKREFRKWDRSLPPGGLSCCTNPECLALPESESAIVRPRVFCASMADVFEDRDDLIPHRERLFALIDATQGLDWLILTKRPENIARLTPRPPSSFENVWWGCTAEDQTRWNERVPELLTNAAGGSVLFVSAEPLLGPIRMGAHVPDWLITGGESGKKPRPSHPNWIRELQRDCNAWGIPFLMKQWGEWIPLDVVPNDSPIRGLVKAVPTSSPRFRYIDHEGKLYASDNAPCGSYLTVRVGKKFTGRAINGQTFTEFPVPRHGGVR